MHTTETPGGGQRRFEFQHRDRQIKCNFGDVHHQATNSIRGSDGCTSYPRMITWFRTPGASSRAGPGMKLTTSEHQNHVKLFAMRIACRFSNSHFIRQKPCLRHSDRHNTDRRWMSCICQGSPDFSSSLFPGDPFRISVDKEKITRI